MNTAFWDRWHFTSDRRINVHLGGMNWSVNIVIDKSNTNLGKQNQEVYLPPLLLLTAWMLQIHGFNCYDISYFCTAVPVFYIAPHWIVNGLPWRTAYHQLVLLPVDDDSSDLLVHEDEDGGEEGGDDCCYGCPPGVATNRRHHPVPVGIRWLLKEQINIQFQLCCKSSLFR